MQLIFKRKKKSRNENFFNVENVKKKSFYENNPRVFF